jgi:hypothetical protein
MAVFDPFSIDAPFDETQFLSNLGAYDSNPGVMAMLELAREIQTSGNYYWQGIPFPAAQNVTVGPFATVNGSIQVPEGSYITSLSHYTDQTAGFKFKLYDKGSKASIFYGDYCFDRIVAGNMNPDALYGAAPTDPGMNGDTPFGPGYLLSPFIVNVPGVMGWEVVNLSSNTATIQMFMAVAIPVNRQSVGQRVVDKGY